MHYCTSCAPILALRAANHGKIHHQRLWTYPDRTSSHITMEYGMIKKCIEYSIWAHTKKTWHCDLSGNIFLEDTVTQGTGRQHHLQPVHTICKDKIFVAITMGPVYVTGLYLNPVTLGWTQSKITWQRSSHKWTIRSQLSQQKASTVMLIRPTSATTQWQSSLKQGVSPYKQTHWKHVCGHKEYSTTDLVFLSCSCFRNIQRAMDWKTGMAPSGKHIPVVTTVEVEVTREPLTRNGEPVTMAWRTGQEIRWRNSCRIMDTWNTIKWGDFDIGMEFKTCSHPLLCHNGTSKPWFDKRLSVLETRYAKTPTQSQNWGRRGVTMHYAERNMKYMWCKSLIKKKKKEHEEKQEWEMILRAEEETFSI